VTLNFGEVIADDIQATKVRLARVAPDRLARDPAIARREFTPSPRPPAARLPRDFAFSSGYAPARTVRFTVDHQDAFIAGTDSGMKRCAMAKRDPCS